ncbi:MAG TPA: SAF domain-containing protein [Acidimicrobiales bacterium]|nr:SAF domain-containing protein [Acidimicrobiales bacterium]
MTATHIRPPRPAGGPGPGAGPAGDGGGRPIRPRRGLPGGRAVVGGLLVAVAAVGTFAAATGAGRGPGHQVVVAARDIAPGTVLSEGDVELVAAELPAGTRGRAFTAPAQVLGAVAVGPLSEGELVQAGGLADGVDAAVPTFSLAVPTAAANGGVLERGDTVQVFATYGSDTTATTRLLAAEAGVVGVDGGDTELGTADQVQVILAIRSAEERSRVINAAVSGAVSLVRTTGAAAPGTVPDHRPDLDGDTAASRAPDRAAGG